MDLRLKPIEKPRPENFPKRDPASFLLPLMDSYAAAARAQNMDNPRFSPIVSSVETLPEHMLLVVAGIDILVHEQLTFVERLKNDVAKSPKNASRRIEALYIDKGFHGYLSCKSHMSSNAFGSIIDTRAVPAAVTSTELKDQAFNAGVDFVKDVHAKNGWKPRD